MHSIRPITTHFLMLLILSFATIAASLVVGFMQVQISGAGAAAYAPAALLVALTVWVFLLDRLERRRNSSS